MLQLPRRSLWFAALFLLGVMLIFYSVIDFGPTIDDSSAVGWWAFGIGLVAIISSGAAYIIDIAFRSTRWTEVIISAAVSLLFFIGYVAWLSPVRGDPVIFHPAIAVFFLSLFWLAIAIYCGFRTSRGSHKRSYQ